MDINNFNAETARLLTRYNKKTSEEQFWEQLTMVYEHIQAVAINEKSSKTFEGGLYPEVIDRIKIDGFEIQIGEINGNIQHTISW